MNEIYIVYKDARGEKQSISPKHEKDDVLFMTCEHYIWYNERTSMFELKTRGKFQSLLYESKLLSSAIVELENRR